MKKHFSCYFFVGSGFLFFFFELVGVGVFLQGYHTFLSKNFRDRLRTKWKTSTAFPTCNFLCVCLFIPTYWVSLLLLSRSMLYGVMILFQHIHVHVVVWNWSTLRLVMDCFGPVWLGQNIISGAIPKIYFMIPSQSR